MALNSTVTGDYYADTVRRFVTNESHNAHYTSCRRNYVTYSYVIRERDERIIVSYNIWFAGMALPGDAFVAAAHFIGYVARIVVGIIVD